MLRMFVAIYTCVVVVFEVWYYILRSMTNSSTLIYYINSFIAWHNYGVPLGPSRYDKSSRKVVVRWRDGTVTVVRSDHGGTITMTQWHEDSDTKVRMVRWRLHDDDDTMMPWYDDNDTKVRWHDYDSTMVLWCHGWYDSEWRYEWYDDDGTMARWRLYDNAMMLWQWLADAGAI